MKYQKTFVTVTFIMGESRGIARYVITPQYEEEETVYDPHYECTKINEECAVSWKIKLYSISPPRSQEWCPPSDWWGMAKLREGQVLKTFLHSFGKTNLTINTSNC